MKQKRKALSPDLARKWAEMAHLLFIDALSSSAPMAVKQIAFHGGTNLHLSWGSPRYSEDLDFLVGREFGARIREVMPRIERRMNALVKAIDPLMKVEIDDRTKDADGMLNFRIKLSSPAIVGQVMAKAEFWQVRPGYIEGYETRFVQPAPRGDFISRISQPIPAATLSSAFADKVVALGYRPHLKWRDLFDLWWISGQTNIDRQEALEKIRHNCAAYSGPGDRNLADGLRGFLAMDPDDIARQADPDLKRWLPRQLWETLNPEGVREIVDHARATAAEFIERLGSEDCPNRDSSDQPSGKEEGDDPGPRS